MKKITVFLIMIIVTFFSFSCKKGSDNSLLSLILLANQLKYGNCIIMTSLDLDAVGNAVVMKNGTITPPAPSGSKMSMAQASIDPRYATSDPSAEIVYLTGRKGNVPVMLELTVSTKAVRTVLFQDSYFFHSAQYSPTGVEGYFYESGMTNIPVTANPTVFTIDGVKYMLFIRPNNPIYGSVFALFEYVSEDSQTITFKVSNRWDFSAVVAWEQSLISSSIVKANCLLPDFNPDTNTLYFSVEFQEKYSWSDQSRYADKSRDALYDRIAYTVLTGTTFGTPAYITGSADPFDASHFSDGLAKTPEDFAVQISTYATFDWSITTNMYHNGGQSLFGRMYATRDGSNKIFFSDLYASFPSQNIYDVDGSTVRFTVSDAEIRATETRMGHTTDYIPYDNTFQFNDLYTADISGGVTTNLKKITSRFDGLKPGVNFISHISDDGTIIYVSHADVYDSENNMIFSPNLTIDLTHVDSYLIPGWVGEVQVYSTTDGGTTYNKIATISKEDVTFEE